MSAIDTYTLGLRVWGREARSSKAFYTQQSAEDAAIQQVSAAAENGFHINVTVYRNGFEVSRWDSTNLPTR